MIANFCVFVAQQTLSNTSAKGSTSKGDSSTSVRFQEDLSPLNNYPIQLPNSNGDIVLEHERASASQSSKASVSSADVGMSACPLVIPSKPRVQKRISIDFAKYK